MSASHLIVVAAHGPDWVGQCVGSLVGCGCDVVVVDTGSGTVPRPDAVLPGGHPTGAYRWAYEHCPADRYLFIQDSMTALEPPIPWFRDQWSGEGAVAWGRFPMQWDGNEQVAWVHDQYGDVPGVTHGVFGPVFYTSRASLDRLAAKDLLPRIPITRLQAQGTERAWAYAYAAAGMPVSGPVWDHAQMQVAWGPFRKVWAGRP